jgi:hypothetical protein
MCTHMHTPAYGYKRNTHIHTHAHTNTRICTHMHTPAYGYKQHIHAHAHIYTHLHGHKLLRASLRLCSIQLEPVTDREQLRRSPDDQLLRVGGSQAHTGMPVRAVKGGEHTTLPAVEKLLPSLQDLHKVKGSARSGVCVCLCVYVCFALFAEPSRTPRGS